MSKNLSDIKLKIVLIRLTEDQYNILNGRRKEIGIPLAVQIRKAVSDYLKMEGGV